jgi:hypothetical protein
VASRHFDGLAVTSRLWNAGEALTATPCLSLSHRCLAQATPDPPPFLNSGWSVRRCTWSRELPHFSLNMIRLTLRGATRGNKPQWPASLRVAAGVSQRVRANRARHNFDFGSGKGRGGRRARLASTKSTRKASATKRCPDGSGKPFNGAVSLSDFANNAFRLTK